MFDAFADQQKRQSDNAKQHSDDEEEQTHAQQCRSEGAKTGEVNQVRTGAASRVPTWILRQPSLCPARPHT